MFDEVDGVWRYRAQPNEVEAVQYTDTDVCEVLVDWGVEVQGSLEGSVHIWNKTSGEWNLVSKGDFVVKDSKGGFYPCDPEVMYNKYIRLGPQYLGEVPPEEEIQ